MVYVKTFNRDNMNSGTRKLHIEVSEDLHQKVRVKAALEDLSIQALVTKVLSEAVADLVMPQVRKAVEGSRTSSGRRS